MLRLCCFLLQDRLAEHRYAAKLRNYDYAMVKHFKDIHNDDFAHVPISLRRGDGQR